MSWQTKMIPFEYIVFRLTQWFTEINGSWEERNDLSKLKLTKLLFFVTASSASDMNPGLLTVFDNFVAMPYGHVESTIHDHMHDSQIFNINKENLTLKPGFIRYDPDLFNNQELKLYIDEAIDALKEKNPILINSNAFDLVNLSHQWQSWITIFSLAKKSGKLSMPIPVEMIMREPKIFK